MLFSLLSSTLLLTANGQSDQILADLENYCGTGGADTWYDVDDDDWYWGNDFYDFVKAGTQKDGVTPGDIYPAGFRSMILPWYNEPPICLLVPESHDKKVEILLESELDNANLCIHDASDTSVGKNDVGSIDNCGTGKIYACFTAATLAASREDFGFYIYCNDGCEESDIPVWIRIRISDRDWDDGKDGVENDLEHWCERERGTHYEGDDDEPLMYTYPSDLLPDEPSKYPFHIKHLLTRSAASVNRPGLWLAALLLAPLVALLA